MPCVIASYADYSPPPGSGSKHSGVKLLQKGCGSPTELMVEIQIPVSRQVAIAHVKLFYVVFFGDRM